MHTQRAHSQHVLLIDDDMDNLEALSEGLKMKGYEVATASNGYEGLDHLRSDPYFDYVICDVGMPGMSGWAVAEKIATLSPRTKIFMLTGWASGIRNTDPRRKLVVDVLAKPMDLDAIDAALLKAL